MTIDFVAELVVAIFLVVGATFAFVGSFGLLKLNDPMKRLHAPTKASTLGVGSILAASILNAWFIRGEGSLHELLVMAFLFVTAPITAHFIAKAHIFRRVPEDELPSAGDDPTWAVLDMPRRDAREL